MSADAIFDALAQDYDAQFSDRLAAGWLRKAVHQRIEAYVRPGQSVIDLGCGSGEDALMFAGRGCRVRALDASGKMLEQARAKLDKAGVSDRVELQQVDMQSWAAAAADAEPQAGLVFSNFGALNCIGDLAAVCDAAHRRLHPGGHMIVIVMGRFCLSETLYFAARGRFRKAARRWSRRNDFSVADATMPVWYHSPRELAAAASGFRRIASYGVGALLPPSEGYGLCERWPRLFGRLAALDFRIARALPYLADHYLMILEKRDAAS